MRTTGFGWALALAVAMAGCGRTHNANEQTTTADANRTGQPAAAASADTSSTAPPASTKAESARSTAKRGGAKAERHVAPITLVGCLEKASRRSDYVLTRLETARTTAGTSGKSAGGQSDSNIGAETQVRTTAHAYRLSGHRNALAPLVGKEVRVKGVLVSSDPARVDVASVDSVSNNCGKSSRSK
jgi:hypothetical protein